MITGMLSIEANGIRHAYLSVGEGPLVLLLHGYPETAHAWLPVMDRLAAAGYRAVAPNLRGYPPTDPAPDGDYSVVTAARDAIALIEALGAERSAVVGLDWGSLIAYAAANLDPARVWKVAGGAGPHPRCLSFADPVLIWRARHVILHQLRGIAEWWTRRNDFAYIDYLYRRWSPHWKAGPEETAPVKEALRAPGGLAGALGYYRCLVAMMFLPSQAANRRLVRQRTVVPAMAFAGTSDGVISARQFRNHEEAFTGPYRMVWIEGAGHFAHRERPDEVAAALLDFLGPASHAPR